jgi:hypothetical protein
MPMPSSSMPPKQDQLDIETPYGSGVFRSGIIEYFGTNIKKGLGSI